MCQATLYNTEICYAIAVAGAIPPLISLMSSKHEAVYTFAASVVESLCHDSTAAAEIGAAGGISRLVRLMVSGPPDGELRAVCATTLGHVSGTPSNAMATAEAGAIPPLIAFLMSPSKELRDAAAYAISCLTSVGGSGTNTTIVAGGAIPALLALLKSPGSLRERA